MPPSLEPTRRNSVLERIWEDNMKEQGLPLDQPEPGSDGSTDVGNISQIFPVIQTRMGICDDETPIHSVAFAEATQSERGRKTVVDAGRLLALTAYDYLVSGELRKAVSEDFNAA